MIDEKDKALRYNAGKTQWSYLPMAEIEDLIKVLEYGATKYTKDNWKKGEYISRITDSLMRHIRAYCYEGEDIDSESGLNHIGHILANVVFLKYNQGHPTFDDRNKSKEKTNG